jgi:hypothetical protein
VDRPPPTSPFGGALGAAKSFDGATAYVDVPNLEGPSNTQFSIESWIKPNGYPGGLHALYAKDGFSPVNGDLHANFNGSTFEMAVAGNPSHPNQDLATVMPTGTWNHFVTTYDRPNSEVKFYANGELVSTKATTGANGVVFGPATIASWGVSRFLGADLDEFAIYQGTVLSADRVAAHYNAAIDPGQLALVETGGPFSGGNLAAATAGATPFALNEAGGNHVTSKLNDGNFGNFDSWIGTGDPDGGFGLDQPGGWYFNILPFLEQSAVREQGRGKTAAEKRTLWTGACATPISTAFCPSRRSPEPGSVGLYASVNHWRNIDLPAKLAHNDYAINVGDQTVQHFDGDYSHHTGISYYKSMIRIADLRDGASNTYLAGEKNLNPDAYENGMSAGDDNCVYGGHDWDIARWTNLAYAPMPDTPGVDFPERFGGPHAGVYQMVLCDGSVRGFSFSIDAEMHRRLGNRHDAEVINLND